MCRCNSWFLLVAVFASGCSGKKDPKPEPYEGFPKLRASDLLNKFTLPADREGAKQRYAGTEIELAGAVVNDPVKGHSGSLWLLVLFDSGSDYQLNCWFRGDEGEKLRPVQLGDRAAVRGTVEIDEVVPWVTLENCKLVRHRAGGGR